MASIMKEHKTKVAISLPKNLLDKTDNAAVETGNSRSGIVAIELREYINRLEQEKILSQLNEVYKDEASISEELSIVNAGKTYVGNNLIEPEGW